MKFIELVFKNKLNLFVFSFLLFSFGSFYVSFFPPDEPKYVDAALKMIESKNYLVPFFNCHVRFDKPILFYWELVAFFKLFSVDFLIRNGIDPLGIIEYAARLPSIISGAFTAIYIYKLSYTLFRSEKISTNSIIAYFSFLFFFYLTRSVYPDMSLILFELMATYYFIEEKYCIAWLTTALAFLVKGPIGIVVPGFNYLLYLWIVKKETGLKKFFTRKNILGLAIFAIVSVPWYLELYLLYGIKFINKFFIYHNIERFTGGAHQHPNPFYYYVPILIAVLFFWWPYVKDLSKKVDLKDSKNRVLLSWFAWVFLFFSMSYNKLPHYIAVSFLPLGILFAQYMDSLENTKTKSVIMFTIELAIGFAISVYLFEERLYLLIPTAFFGIVCMGMLNFAHNPKNTIFYKTIIVSLFLSITLMQLESHRPEKKIWKIMLNNPYPLYEFRINNQSLIAYTRRCLKDTGSIIFFKNKKDTFYVYTKRKYLSYFKNYKVIFFALDRGEPTALIKIEQPKQEVLK
ncbi:ArnT family glycosyltransferase [Hippea maritima]|uniref:Glycosyl transferase family 39 n=1 Tax=Hippea maritima (strain ATCC 700847 / DSM 10411 / MH2) TaxID=760142 RepID=F2LXH9_HIPMA|nr:glycosyltransferase family 39 protein [Hippea maritima]AEA33165.1 glycosyl transferase family 39 [Hippea maritima DSM 10411]